MTSPIERLANEDVARTELEVKVRAERLAEETRLRAEREAEEARLAVEPPDAALCWCGKPGARARPSWCGDCDPLDDDRVAALAALARACPVTPADLDALEARIVERVARAAVTSARPRYDNDNNTHPMLRLADELRKGTQ